MAFLLLQKPVILYLHVYILYRMNISKVLAFGCLSVLLSCTPSKNVKIISSSEINAQVHGHRGAAGHRPQNSLEGFLYAVDLGVDALEMDVVISKDKQVVVSHEPYMASDYVLTPKGKEIPHARERSYNLYKMDYAEIREFDIGSKWDFRFFWKKRVKASKPLLETVVETVETHIKEKNLKPVTYSIELKSVPSEYGEFQPQPEEFIDLVMPILERHKFKDRLIIQSFDANLLNLLHARYPEIPVSYLVENDNPEKQLAKLDFTPDFYSADHRFIRTKPL